MVVVMVANKFQSVLKIDRTDGDGCVTLNYANGSPCCGLCLMVQNY